MHLVEWLNSRVYGRCHVSFILVTTLAAAEIDVPRPSHILVVHSRGRHGRAAHVAGSRRASRHVKRLEKSRRPLWSHQNESHVRMVIFHLGSPPLIIACEQSKQSGTP